jgi:hypothetical protein
MRKWINKTMLVLSVFIVYFVPNIFMHVSQVQAGTTHFYTGGIVQEITQSEIWVGANRYTLAPSLRVIDINKRNNAYYEDRSSLYQVRSGQPVRVKVEGSTVYEILIERWKQ